MSANPSWYDVLDVDATASADEIRAAWKSAIAELDPTDRRFRVLNQAAEVLLDPESRAEYDQSIEPAPESEPTPDVATVTRPQVTGGAEPGRSVEGGSPSAGTRPPATLDAEPEGSAANPLPAWILAALGVVLAALIGLCVWQFVTMPPSDEEVAEATGDAQAAAEKAAVAILSYDYRSLDDDEARAASYMTEEYKKEKYDPLFAVIRENSEETKTILSTEVVGSSIVRSGDDRVQIFLFINMPTLKADLTEPEIYRNQVTMTMEKVGDAWLVDELETS